MNYERKDTAFSIGTREVSITQRGNLNTTGHTGGVMWGGAYVLAKYLERHHLTGEIQFEGKR